MRVVGYVLLAALGVLVLLLLAAVIRTLCTKKKTSDYTPHPDAAREREYAEKLSRMVAYETVSHPDDPELEKFRGFHKLLAELYPTVHEKLEKTEIDGNLLFFWEGKNHDRPLVLMSHQDVVPAEGTWEHAPFSGDIADGKVWGRGLRDLRFIVQRADDRKAQPRPRRAETARERDDAEQDADARERGKRGARGDGALHFRFVHTDGGAGAVGAYHEGHAHQRNKENNAAADEIHGRAVELR